MKWFAHIYFMKNEPANIRQTIPGHVKYWEGLDLPHFLGGPFADRSGGLIVFQAPDIVKATKIIENDPFVLANVIENRLIKEWALEQYPLGAPGPSYSYAERLYPGCFD